MDFLVSTQGGRARAIWARYSRPANVLQLYDDSGTALLGASCTPGVAGVLENGQGRLICGRTTVTGTGDKLVVRWSVAPKRAFASARPKRLILRAEDDSGAVSSWRTLGSWTITP